MRLLSVEDSLVLDGAVAAPVAHGCQAVVDHVPGDGPVLQHHRRHGGEPGQAAAWHRAFRLSHRQAHRNIVRVTGKPAIDALNMPELVERRVQVQVDTYPNGIKKRWVCK